MTDSHSIPASELYWGMIETRDFPPIPFGVIRPGAVRARLENQFDAVLPCPVENLHAVFHQLGNGRFLACGIEHDRIAALHADGLPSVVPDSIPGAATLSVDSEIAPDGLELLAGPYTPHHVVARLTRNRRIAAAALLLVAIFVSGGNLRRAAAYRSEAAEFREQQAALYLNALGPGIGSTPPQIRLTTELRRLSKTRGERTASPQQNHAPHDLQSVLEVWPSDAELRIERISVDGNRIDITGEAADSETVRELITALKRLEGWSLPMQRIDQSPVTGLARARLGLERVQSEEGQS